MRVTAVFWLVLGHLSVCQGDWRCTQGPSLNQGSLAAQVDASLGQLVAMDTNHQAYYLSGDYWTPLPYGNLKQVSVGQAGMWAVDGSSNVYKYVGARWVYIPGGLMQIDAGGDGFVVGVNASDQIFCLQRYYTIGYKGVGAVHWTPVTGPPLKYFSCGPYGCWGVPRGRNDTVFFHELVHGPSCRFRGWQQIPVIVAGGLTMIKVGTDGNMFGVGLDGHVYQRTGINSHTGQGRAWQRVSCFGTRIKQVSYDLGTIYGVSTTGVIMKATE